MPLWIEEILFFLIKVFLSFLFYCYTASASAHINLVVLPDDHIAPLINAIKSTQQELNITIYGFTDKKIADELIKLKKRGVNIRLLIESSPYQAQNENKAIIQYLKKHGILIAHPSKNFPLTHQKTILIDQRKAIILTENLTYSGFHHQRNFMVITDEKEVVDALEKLFETDWQHKPNASIFSWRTLVVSPENSFKKINNIIQHTHKNLDIYAAALTDKRIIYQVKKVKIPVRLIVSFDTKIIKKEALCQDGIEIHALKKSYQHAKALLSDYGEKAAIAYIGSANLSFPGLSQNREVGILLFDKNALKRLHDTFEADWKNSRNLCFK